MKPLHANTGWDGTLSRLKMKYNGLYSDLVYDKGSSSPVCYVLVILVYRAYARAHVCVCVCVCVMVHTWVCVCV